jgi:L-cystine transport system permease protein
MESGLSLVLQSAPFLLKGCVYTVVLAVSSMALGLVLGFGLAMMRLSPLAAVRLAARAYVSAFRGTPLLVQLFLIYYGLPQLGVQIEPMPSAIIGFTLNVGAYASEILRGAIAGVDRGQWEAASALGMSRGQMLARVILPQAARTALPPLGNSFIGLVKDTSLAATIQVPELFRQAQMITARTFEIFAMYLSTAAIYWLVSSGLAALQGALEARATRHGREPPR